MSTITIDSMKVRVPQELASLKGRGAGRLSAFANGASAASLGNSRDTCPYESSRGSGSYRKAWLDGFDAFSVAHERAAS